MPRRGPMLRGISKHQSYEIADIASKLRVARGTVARWLKAGLPAIKDRKPYLIQGADLIAFHADRKRPKQKCGSAECYCFRCHVPRRPALDMADIVIATGPTGNLHALCEVCTTHMHKRVSLKHLDALCAVLDVAIRQAPARITKCANPCLNDTLR
jgi:hypothetical protein